MSKDFIAQEWFENLEHMVELCELIGKKISIIEDIVDGKIKWSRKKWRIDEFTYEHGERVVFWLSNDGACIRLDYFMAVLPIIKAKHMDNSLVSGYRKLMINYANERLYNTTKYLDDKSGVMAMIDALDKLTK